MSKPIRMFEIIGILRGARRPLRAEDIAGRLSVSVRTIYRDIAALQAMAVPIDGAAGVGYLLRPGFDLPPLNFSADEVEAIAIGLALLGRTGDRGLAEAAESVAVKIAAARPGQPRAALAASSWHAIPATGADPALIRRAIRECEALDLTYRNADGLDSRRRVLPLALIYYVDAQVLAAWCEMRRDFRHFRLDRMTGCTPAGESFRNRAEGLRLRWQVAGGRAGPGVSLDAPGKAR